MKTHSSTTWYQRWGIWVRRAWLLLAATALLLVFIGVPVRYRELLTVSPNAAIAFGQLRPQDLTELYRTGLSLEFYAGYFTVAETVTALVFGLVALFIFWRRSDEWIALFVATMLLLLPSVLPVVSAVQRAELLPALILQAMQGAYYACLGTFFFVFPDGHVVPRWARGIVILLLSYALLALLFPAIAFPASFGAGVSAQQFIPLGAATLLYLIGFGAQIYRYFRISNATQRQQTKWVVLGLAVFSVFATLGITFVVTSTFRNDGAVDLQTRMLAPSFILVAILAVPLAIGFSILRYRLYDIDIIVRRTVTYAVVVALLLIVYFASVILLQRLFAGITGRREEFVTVLSTLAIAALFVPLRNRIQALIDRRFNRKKYDAQKVLEKFGETVRDETDLEKLTNELVKVVQETMQPKSVSVWLKQEPRGKR